MNNESVLTTPKTIQKQLLNQTISNKISQQYFVKDLEGIWWDIENTEENSLFVIEEDSIEYVESLGKKYNIKINNNKLIVDLDGFKSVSHIISFHKDTLWLDNNGDTLRLIKSNQ